MPTPERPRQNCASRSRPRDPGAQQNCAAVLCRAAPVAAGRGAEFATQACVGEGPQGQEESQTLDPAWNGIARADLRGMGVAAGSVAVHWTGVGYPNRQD